MRLFCLVIAASATSMALPAQAADAPEPAFFAVGATAAEGAIVFDTASRQVDGQTRSIRVLQFAPVPFAHSGKFYVGRSFQITVGCAPSTFALHYLSYFSDPAAPDRLGAPRGPAHPFNPPADPNDSSLAGISWRYLCQGQQGPEWVGYAAADLVAIDYWASRDTPIATDRDPFGVEPPHWAGPNAIVSTMPPPPPPNIPF